MTVAPPTEIGSRYGRLVVVAQAEREVGVGRAFSRWRCQCDCGKQSTTRCASLRSGRTTSCGCIAAERMRGARWRTIGVCSPRRIVAMNRAFNNMRQNARTRGIEWAIPDDVLEHLCAQPCHYCGDPPSNGNDKKTAGAYLYSGLDRLDSDRAYRVDNVVPCCRICNVAKRDLTMPKFIAWARRLSAAALTTEI